LGIEFGYDAATTASSFASVSVLWQHDMMKRLAWA